MQVAINLGRPKSSVEDPSNYMKTYGHEFGHLLGTGDKDKGFMQSGGYAKRLLRVILNIFLVKI